jgi:hypothetical protein
LASFWTTRKYSSGALRGNSPEATFSVGKDEMKKAMSDWSRRHITLPALLAAACGFMGYATVFVAQRRDMVTQRGNSSGALHLAQDIHEEDRNFLDDLVRKENQGDHQNGNPLSASDPNTGKAGTIDSIAKAVPRAELVVNSEIVRRGELVVHGGTVSRKRQIITP